MNKRFVMIHLQEAMEQLQDTIKAVQEEGDYGREEFQVGMGHIYHHLNTAWNAQDASAERHKACSDEDFNTWRQFPKESELMLGT